MEESKEYLGNPSINIIPLMAYTLACLKIIGWGGRKAQNTARGAFHRAQAARWLAFADTLRGKPLGQNGSIIELIFRRPLYGW